MNDHPDVLQQGVESGAVGRNEAGIQGKHRHVYCILQQREGRATNFPVGAYVATQHHRQQQALDEAKYHHQRGFSSVSRSYEYQPYQGVPENPDKKAPLLPFPEAGDDEVKWQTIGRMLPGVVVTVIVLIKDEKQHHHRQHNSRRVCSEHAPAHADPGLSLRTTRTRSIVIADHGGERCHQAHHDAHVPYVAQHAIHSEPPRHR